MNMDQRLVAIRNMSPKSRAVADEVLRLRNYIRVIDPPRQPSVAVSRAEIRRDGFIPSFVLIRMMKLAEEKAKTKQARKERWASARQKVLGFVNLGFCGWWNGHFGE